MKKYPLDKNLYVPRVPKVERDPGKVGGVTSVGEGHIEDDLPALAQLEPLPRDPSCGG